MDRVHLPFDPQAGAMTRSTANWRRRLPKVLLLLFAVAQPWGPQPSAQSPAGAEPPTLRFVCSSVRLQLFPGLDQSRGGLESSLRLEGLGERLVAVDLATRTIVVSGEGGATLGNAEISDGRIKARSRDHGPVAGRFFEMDRNSGAFRYSYRYEKSGHYIDAGRCTAAGE